MQGQTEVLKILGEFTEITDNVKLIQMSVLINTYKVPKRSKEEFQRILKTVPVDMVREALRKKIIQDFFLKLLGSPEKILKIELKNLTPSPVDDVPK